MAVDEFFNMFSVSKQPAPPITAEPKWENKVENWAANNVENIKFEGSPLIEKNHMGAQVFYPSNNIGLTPKHSASDFSQPGFIVQKFRFLYYIMKFSSESSVQSSTIDSKNCTSIKFLASFDC
jgi:hypothetical protein